MSTFKKWLGFQQTSSRKSSSSERRSPSHSSVEGPKNGNNVGGAGLDESDGTNGNGSGHGHGHGHGHSERRVSENSRRESDVRANKQADEDGGDLNGNGNGIAIESFGSVKVPSVVSPEVPFGIGATKVFGYENFGNTCYCNSVLQCLYNLTEFRTEILKNPPRDASVPRVRKSSMTGSKPRVFTEASFTPQQPMVFRHAANGTLLSVNNQTLVHGDSNSSSDNHRRGSLKFFKNYTESSASNSSATLACSKTKSAPSSAPGQTTTTTQQGSATASIPAAASIPIATTTGVTGATGAAAAAATTSSSASASSSRPVQTVVMPSDPISEKLHENHNKIIVGRTQGTPFQSSACETNNRSNSNSLSDSNSSSSSAIAGLASQTTGTATTSETATAAASNASPSTTGTITASTGVATNSSTAAHKLHNAEPTIEQRKKAALMKGPIVNIDISVADYLSKGEKPTLYSALKDIFECIAENDSPIGVVSPSNFVNILKQENILFSSSMHQDAHEFLNYLLNELSDSLKRLNCFKEGAHEENITFVEDLFKGSLFNSTKCFTCDNITTRDEPFLDFPIEIQEDEEIKIQDILSNYKHRELLTGANKFYCDKCCGLQEAERIVGLKSLPKTLAIHLKRFKYSEVHNCNAKLFNRIHYPLDLTVCSSFDNAVCKDYELNGIVIHMGGGPHHGHYVAICKNDVFGWLLFDDETVESITEETVLKFIGDSQELTTAYVLIYKEASRSSGPAPNYEKSIEHLIKDDEQYRRKSSAKTSDGVLQDVPEEGSHGDSKHHKTKSKLFNFKRSGKT